MAVNEDHTITFVSKPVQAHNELTKVELKRDVEVLAERALPNTNFAKISIKK